MAAPRRRKSCKRLRHLNREELLTTIIASLDDDRLERPPGEVAVRAGRLTRSTLSTQFSPRPPALRFHGDGTRDCGAATRNSPRRAEDEAATIPQSLGARWRRVHLPATPSWSGDSSWRPSPSDPRRTGSSVRRRPHSTLAGFSTKSVTRTGRSLPGLSSGLPPRLGLFRCRTNSCAPSRFPRSRRSRWSAPSPSSHRSGDALCSSQASPLGTRARRARPRATPAPALYPPCWR